MLKLFLKSKKIVLVVLFIIIGVLIIVKYIFDYLIASYRSISRGIVRRNEQNENTYKDLLSNDEINVVLVGTAGPMSPELAQSSTALFVNGQFLLFDAGDYAQKRMEQFKLPLASIDAVFLTHLHNDHIADLGEVMQRNFFLRRQKDFLVYGPTGTKEVVNGFNMVYGADSSFRTEHHTEEYMPSEYHFAKAKEFDGELEEVIVYEKDDVVVTAFQNYHPPIEPTFGYIIEYDGKKVVISGDKLITEELAQYSNSADLPVMDIMNYELVKLIEETYRGIGDERIAQIMYDIREYHPD